MTTKDLYVFIAGLIVGILVMLGPVLILASRSDEVTIHHHQVQPEVVEKYDHLLP